MLLFDGWSCSVAAMAPAFCSESADWPMSCSPPLPHLHLLPPVCDWSAAWPVQLTLPADAFDDAVFDCVTEPPSPGLKTRTVTFEFDGFSCFVAAKAPASWSESADWPMACVPPSPPHLQESPPSCVCPAVCFVAFRLPASAFDDAAFDCETSPSLPGLRTRTLTFSFDGFVCSVAASAAASCSESADCPMTCSPPLAQQPLPACSCSAVCSVPFA